MTTIEPNCEREMIIATPNPSNGQQTLPMSIATVEQNQSTPSSKSLIPPPDSTTATLEASSLKRARLSPSIPAHNTTNGFNTRTDPPPKSQEGIHEEIVRTVRPSFDVKFKLSLQQNMSVYLARLNCTEETVEKLRKEFHELTERMDCIESSSKDLRQLLTEKVNLPVPTAGIGQRRTMSSQAPRPTPFKPTTTMSAPIPVTTHGFIVNSTTHHPPTISNHSPNPIATPGTGLTNQTIPTPKNITNAVTTQSLPTTPRSALTPTQPQRQPLPPVVNQPPTPASVTASRAPLTVRPMDTIDLTAESSPTMGGTVEEEAAALDRRRKSNSMKLATCSVTSAIPNKPIPTSVPTVPFGASANSRIAWLSTQDIQPPVPRAPPPPRVPDLKPAQMTFRELQQLPVAPLPPTPFQAAHNCSIQPMPQLTIAEAAEGVCLQWTIAYPPTAFEPATAYEIYSYASSELTYETIQTCVPWKKVGEVAALPLPMACTLTHVQSNNLYYFIVRSVDRFRRYSSWSNVVNAFVA